mgnify:CR=1 FL=1|jgi:hypothetical protein
MLNARELWKEQEAQKSARMRAMRPVLAGLFHSIKVHAQQNPDAPYYAFDVPSFVFGYPLFNHEEAIQYVKETLEEQGFQVIRGSSPPSILMISWIKPAPKRETTSRPPKAGPDYRPFVYDESAFAYLTRK